MSNTAGQITYQWYKAAGEGDGTKIEGATEPELTVKNVSDSGTYYAKAYVMVDEVTLEAESTHVQVKIQKADLKIQIKDHTITYGDLAPEYQYEFVDDTELLGTDTFESVFGVSCPVSAYTQWSDVGLYDITLNTDHVENYQVVVTNTKGTLTVQQKNVEAPGANVEIQLEKDHYVYDPAGVSPTITVMDGTHKVDATEYSTSYSNNTKAGAAKVTAAFPATEGGNYTGSLSKEYTIIHADYTTEAVIKGWTYGETPSEPAVDNNPGSGDVEYFYYEQGQDKSSAVTQRPENAGNYCMYAVVAETEGYESITTGPVEFTIAKRKITLTAASGNWEYDGEEHVDPSYTMTGSFAGTDSLLSVTVTGSIRNTGTVENKLTYTLSTSTNGDNYDIQCVNGTLTITAKALNAPTNVKWEESEPGTGSWIFVKPDGIDIKYELQLYHCVEQGERILEEKVGDLIETEENSYDFSELIRHDAEEVYANEGKKAPTDYYFTVETCALNNENYGISTNAEKSGKLHTVSIIMYGTKGIKSAKLTEQDRSIEEPKELSHGVLIEGESARIDTELETGYQFPEMIWSMISTQQEVLTITDPTKASTTIQVSSALTKSYEIGIVASSTDDMPLISRFEASEVAGSQNREVQFELEASDTSEVTRWAITTTKKVPDADSLLWNVVKEEEVVESEEADIRYQIRESYTIAVGDFGESTEKTYYAWVMDSAGNISGHTAGETEESTTENVVGISIYRISFAGNGANEGAMPDLLKIQGKAIRLPQNTFTRTGFEFVNWKGEKGIYVDEDLYAMNSSDYLTAQWTNQKIQYQVDYYYMDIDGSYPAVPKESKTFQGAFNEEIRCDNSKIQNLQTGLELDREPCEGYVKNITLDKAGRILKIYYKRRTYTLTYSYLEPGKSIATEIKENYRYGQSVPTQPPISIPGYQFVGWLYGEAGKVPDFMPSKDITATGYFVAEKAVYQINYYTENLESGSYTQVSELGEQKESVHAAKISASIENAKEIEGFEVAGITVTGGTAGASTVPAGELEQEVTGSVSAVDGEMLHINYYYKRKSYSITLQIWKGTREEENLVTSYAFKNIPYGKAFSESELEGYANHDKINWQVPAGYRLADYVDWSTGNAPSTMPAGDVTVSRDYVKTKEASYQVEIYLENDARGYQRYGSMTFYASSKARVELVNTSNTTGNNQVTIDSIRNTIDNGECFLFDGDNAGNVLTGLVPDPDEVALDPTKNDLKLRVYFKRKEFNTTINYFYYPEGGGSSSDKKAILIGSLTKKGKWNTNFNFDPVALFDGKGVPGSWASEGTWTSGNVTIDGTAAEQYDFRNHKYLINYQGRYMIDGYYHYPQKNLLSVEALKENYQQIYGSNDNNYINIYYYKADLKKHYDLQVKLDPERLKNKTTIGSNEQVPVTESIDGETYQIWIRNKADLFEATYEEGTNSEYPGLNTIQGEYVYSKDESGKEKLREGYKELTHNEVTYYVNEKESEKRLYVADEQNQLIEGNYAYYNWSFLSGLGLSFVQNYLDQYKEEQEKIEELDQPEQNYDKEYKGIEIYSGGFGSFIYSDAVYAFTFRYGVQYNLNLYLGGDPITLANYSKAFVVGDTISIAEIAGKMTAAGKDKAGYDIVWYRDANYQNKAVDFKIQRTTNLYGRYEKTILSYHDYVYYQLPDPLIIDGEKVWYITEKNYQKVMDALGGKTGFEGKEVETEVEYKDEFNREVKVPIKNVYYYYDNRPVMIEIEHPCLSFSEVKMNKEEYQKSGFHYDDTMSDSMIQAYCQTSAINLRSYWARDEYSLTIDLNQQRANATENSLPVTTSYRSEETVVIEKPVNNGYAFAGWKLEKADGKKENGETIWKEIDLNGSDEEWPKNDAYFVIREDGSGSIRMPAMNIKLTAQWTEATYDKVITHYFQDETKTYQTQRMEQIRNAKVLKNTQVVQEGETRDAVLYYEDSAHPELLGVSVKNGDYTYYYSELEEGAVQKVSTVELIAATSVIRSTTKAPVTLKEHIFENEAYQMFQPSFVVYQTTLKVETYMLSGVGETSVPYEYDSTIDYYYTRNSGYSLRVAAKSEESGAASGATLIGAGGYNYGDKVEIKVSLAQGYELVGWYRASDVLTAPEDAPTTSGEVDWSKVDLNAAELKENWELASKVSTEASFTVRLTESVDYVAVTRPVDVVRPEVKITGQNEYLYGYDDSTSRSDITATVTFPEGADSASSVEGYQWFQYESGEPEGTWVPMEGATSATYHFSKKDCGTYQYKCRVTVGRKDNGRKIEVWAEAFVVTVHKVAMGVVQKDYEGIYDGKEHSFELHTTPLFDTSEIYYSLTTELTAENYHIGSSTRPVFCDVKVDEAGNVIPYIIYYYIKDTAGNYEEKSGSASVLIRPVTLKLTAQKTYTRTYDGTDMVSGEGDKQELTTGGYYKVSGLLTKDSSALLDFTAVYNSAHVEEASTLTLSDLQVEKKTKEKNNNYTFPEGYQFVMPGRIKAYELNNIWNEKNEYIYNGQPQRPGITILDQEKIPDEDMKVEVAGEQTAVGSYTAYANVQKGTQYELSDYKIKNKSCNFVIRKRDVQITAIDRTVEYDRQSHQLEEYAFTVDEKGGIAEGQTYTVKASEEHTNAGTYQEKVRDLRIYQNGKEVTDNYAITYQPGTLNITRKEVSVSGIMVVNGGKEYDGTNAAEPDLGHLIFAGKVAGDDLTLERTKISGTYDTAECGSNKTVTFAYTAGTLSGTSEKNYSLNIEASQKTVTAFITKAVLTVQADNISTIYGESAPFSVQYTGFKKSGDSSSLVRGAVEFNVSKKGSGEAARPYVTTDGQGEYEIQIDVSGLSADNYIFAVGTAPAVLTVKKRPLQVEAVEKNTGIVQITKEYDGTTEATSFVQTADYHFTAVPDVPASGLVNGDSQDLDGFDAAYNSKDVESADRVTVSDLVLANDNYELTASSFDIKAVITPRPVRVTPDPMELTYGDEIPAQSKYSAKYEGMATGETEEVLGTLVYTCPYNTKDKLQRRTGEYEIALSGLNNTNYTITYETSTLTVHKAKVRLVAENKTMNYGDEQVPVFTSHYETGDFKYGERPQDPGLITGDVAYTCLNAAGIEASNSSPAGEYSIRPVIGAISSTNYYFEIVPGILKIERYQLTISGIRVAGKVYDGTTEVKSSAISGMTLGDLIESDRTEAERGITVKGTYTDKNAGPDKEVKLTYELSDYMKLRYQISSKTQKTAESTIEKKDLTITAEDMTVKYGTDDSKIEYKVRYDGFAEGEDKNKLTGGLGFVDSVENHNVYQTGDPVGEYQIIPKGYLGEKNYRITFVEGKLIVTKGQLAAPTEVIWDTNRPGTLTWKEVTGIGTSWVKGYRIDVYKAGKTAAQDTVIASEFVEATVKEEIESVSKDFAAVIQAQGAGRYYAKVIAQAHSIERAGSSNVEDSTSSTSDALYAAEIITKYAADTISQAGSGSISINGTDRYVMLAGQTNEKLEAVLENGTGYSVDKWVSDNNNATVTEIEEGKTMINGIEKTRITAVINLSAELSSESPINLTLSLKTTPAKVEAVVEPVTKEEVFYGYTEEQAQVFKVTAKAPEDDNIRTEDYEYRYQWFIREKVTEDYRKIEGAKKEQFSIPVGYTASELYRVRCLVTALRKDNGVIGNVTTSGVSFSIKKAIYASFVRFPDDEGGWTYGESRKQPYVTMNPENAAVTYQYCEKKQIQTSDMRETIPEEEWSNEVPTDAGRYYVRAVIAQSVNYEKKITDPIEFEIRQAQLEVPTNIRVMEAYGKPYGFATWTPIEGPKENGGVDSKSDIKVRYEIILYHSENADPKEKDWVEYGRAITDDPSFDGSQFVNKPGTYTVSVRAILAEKGTEEEKARAARNCRNSEESQKCGQVSINAFVASEGDIFEKEYDGTPITLWIESARDDGEEESLNIKAYQWYRNNAKIDGETGENYTVSYVGETGNYTCEVTLDNGRTFFTNSQRVRITPRSITVESNSAQKEYDGTILTAQKNGITSEKKLAEGEEISCTYPKRAKTVEDGTVENSMEDLRIYHTDEKGNKILVYNETDAGEVVGSENNYTVTKRSGTLQVTARSLNTDRNYTEGIEVSQPEPVTYNGELQRPAITVQDAMRKDDGQTLVENTDYSLNYYANFHAGTAKIIITGRGNYTGAIERTFRIDQKEIQLTSETRTESYQKDVPLYSTYDSSADQKSVTCTQGSFAAGDALTAVIFENAQLDVGNCENSFTGIVIEHSMEGSNKIDVTKDYNITKVNGTLTVTRAEDMSLLVKMDPAVREYDGTIGKQPLFTKVEGGGEVSFAFFTKDEEGQYHRLEGQPKDAGTYYVKAYEAESQNYAAKETDYVEFKITPRKIDITVNDQTGIYGEKIKELTRSMTGSVVNKESLEIELSTTAKQGSNVDKYPIRASYRADPNYQVTVAEGIYEITPAEMSFDASSYTGEYDGDPHSIIIEMKVPQEAVIYYAEEELNKNNYNVIGEQENLQYTDACPDTGSYQVYYYIKDENDNYFPVSGMRTVTIKKKTQNITVKKNQFRYDGNYHQVEAVTSGDGTLSYMISDVANDQGVKDAGVYGVKITAAETRNYEEANWDTDLIIDQRNLTIQTGSANKKYDGTPLTCNVYELKQSGTDDTLAETDEFVSVSIDGTITDAGEEKNTVASVVIQEKVGKRDVTDNYKINVLYGMLRVDPVTDPAFTINTEKMNKIYDGKPVEDPTEDMCTRKGKGALSFTYYTKKSEDSYQKMDQAPLAAGTYYVKGTEAKSGNYLESESTYTKFRIEPRPVKIVVADKTSKRLLELEELTYELQYNAEPMQRPVLIPGDDLKIHLTTEAMNTSPVGKYDINALYDLNPNYQVSVQKGTYEITEGDMVYFAADYNGVYDKRPHSITLRMELPEEAEIYYYAVKKSEEGVTDPGKETGLTKENYKELGSTEKPEFTDVGDYIVYFYIVAANFADQSGKREVHISKASHNIRVDKSHFVYDGQIHQIEAVVDGEDTSVLSYAIDGQESTGKHEVGNYEVLITAAETKNYIEETLTADLVIAPRPLSLTADSAQKIYDGTPLTKNSYQLTGGSLVEGDTIFSAQVEGSITEAGSVENVVKNAVIHRGEEDVTKNYGITYHAGTLTISKMETTIQFTQNVDDQIGKYYDKQLAKEPAYHRVGDGPISIRYYEEQEGQWVLLPESPVNAGSYGVQVWSGETRNYKEGKSSIEPFEIRPAPVTIVGNDAESRYQEPVAAVSASVAEGTIYPGDDLMITAATTVTEESAVGDYPVTPVYQQDENYQVTTRDGTYHVKPAELKIEVPDMVTEYDGTHHYPELIVPDEVVIYYSEVPLDETNFAIFGSMEPPKYVNAGVYKVYYYLHSVNYEDVSGVTIIVIEKTLPKITAESSQAVYDGTVHHLVAQSTGESALTYEENTFTEAGTYEVKITSEETVNFMEHTVTLPYTITKREITLTAGSRKEEYEGEAITESSYKITGEGLAEGQKIDSVTITGEQSLIGSSANKISSAKIIDQDGYDVTENYDITYVEGRLTLTGDSRIPQQIEPEESVGHEEIENTPFEEKGPEDPQRPEVPQQDNEPRSPQVESVPEAEQEGKKAEDDQKGPQKEPVKEETGTEEEEEQDQPEEKKEQTSDQTEDRTERPEDTRIQENTENDTKGSPICLLVSLFLLLGIGIAGVKKYSRKEK